MHPICITCGTQFGTAQPPARCPICDEPRQYVGLEGQQWTTLSDLRATHRLKWVEEAPGLSSFSIEPKFGIGQRAFVVRTPAGNILWDCVSLLDDDAVTRIHNAGGLSAIAISHPHYYTTMVEWSRAFGGAPIYLHADDAEWVMRADDNVRFWRGETADLPGGLRLIRCGGHFAGAAVLHWPAGADGRGALLTGDTIQVVPDRRSVSFMYSYPNYIPLDARAVQRIVGAVAPYDCEIIYGAFPQLTVREQGKAVVMRSATRYLHAIAPR